MMDLKNKIAVVTGAASGIGQATALKLAAAGAKVVAADVDKQGCEAVAKAIRLRGGAAIACHADVSKSDDVKRTIDLAESGFGGLDILHNNAGVLSGPRFPDSGPEHWDRALGINIRGVLAGIHYGVPALKRRGGGAIVNTASISGLKPHLIDPIYGATKAAVVSLTRAMIFLESEANIRVNCVCPDLVRTDLDVHSSASFDPATREAFLKRRERMKERPALTSDEVADAVLELICNETINGKAYRMVVGEPGQLV